MNNWNKHSYRALLLLSFLGINALILFGISSVLSYLNTGADRSSILHLEVGSEDAYLPKISWSTAKNKGRPIEEPLIKEIEKDYLQAWYLRNAAFKNNDDYGLSNYFTDSIHTKIFNTIKFNKEQNTTINSTTLSHNPSIDFYSADGKLVVFTDSEVISYEEVYSKDELVLQQKDTTTYQVIMLLEDGFWRIRQLVKLEAENNQKSIKEKALNIKGAIERIRGINYYPKENPWAMFNDFFKESIIDKDFKIIRKMGLNTVRIFVQYKGFGKSEVLVSKLAKLKTVLDIATKNELKIIVTLFDFYGNYDLMDWTLTQKHAEKIVSALKDHSALLAWDLKNEPDLDFKGRGNDKVLSWLKEHLSLIKSLDKKHPVTIGWSNPEAATLLVDKVDFISFHYYKEIENFREAYKRLASTVPYKAILLQEYGYSSYGGIWNLYSGSEIKQEHYYKEVQALLKKEKIPFMFWTLYDFEEIPTNVAGSLPWKKEKQKYFGSIRTDGSHKRAFRYLNEQ
jgi:hypothetical protein